MDVIRHLNLRSSLSLLLIVLLTFFAIMIIEKVESSITNYSTYISVVGS